MKSVNRGIRIGVYGILVNDNNNLAIKFDILKQKIDISEKKFIFCINKKDLFSSKIQEIKTNYSKINKIRNEPIFVSALNGEGIGDLKKKINLIGTEIIENKKRKKIAMNFQIQSKEN